MAIDRKFLDANHADLVAQIRAEGRTEGVTEGHTQGATAERQRIQAVFAQSMPGHEALVKTLAFDGKTTGPEAAVQVLAAEKAKLTGKGADIAADAAALSGAGPTPSADPGAGNGADADAGKSVEERCKAKWNADAKVRGEFPSLGAYTAFTRASEAGRIRVQGKRAA